VVGAAERQLALLTNRSARTESRLKAVEWVLHLVADAELPLHVVFADDRGGNSFQAQAFGQGSNMHLV
jgi:nuclease S1